MLKNPIFPILRHSTSHIRSASTLTLRYTDEVKDALNSGKPVVALESTIISHGMPFPSNVEMATSVEQIVRDNGAVPATIAVIDGEVNIGLDSKNLDTLATSQSVQKCSLRDLPVVMAQKRHGATTVAATMHLAHLAGIDVFVTGGVGGVHRGAEDTMDISADLTELGRTPVAVVCAGVKSILDIPRTLEVLETQGVPVVTLGAQNFPAFFSPDSGVRSPHSLSTEADIAASIHASAKLQLNAGTVVAVPNPKPADSAVVEEAVQATLREAEDQGICGRDVTPFVLKRVSELTGGASLDSNIALVKNNAIVGSRIAVKLRTLQTGVDESDAPILPKGTSKKDTRVVVVGGATVDLVSTPSTSVDFQLGTSLPGSVSQHWGGVGRNIAECLARLGEPPLLIAAVGDDSFGESLTSACVNMGMPRNGFLRDDKSNRSTAVYAATLDNERELVMAVADMDVMDTVPSPEQLCHFENDIDCAKLVVVDGNLSEASMSNLTSLCSKKATPLFFEPTSVPKAIRAVNAGILNCSHLTYLSPNVDELRAMVEASGLTTNEGKSGDSTENLIELAQSLIHKMRPNGDELKHIIVTRGSEGALLVSGVPAASMTMTAHNLTPPTGVVNSDGIVNCTGAGDTLVGAMVWGLIRGHNAKESLKYGMHASCFSVMAQEAVSCKITAEALLNEGK